MEPVRTIAMLLFVKSPATDVRELAGFRFAKTFDLKSPSRQMALAAKKEFLRLHLRHLEQIAQHVEPVTARQLHEIGNLLRNEGCRLIRSAIP